MRVALAPACAEWGLTGAASSNQAPVITVGHWAAAQIIAERWRADAHRILAAALEADAQEATNKDVETLIALLRNGSTLRGDALQKLK